MVVYDRLLDKYDMWMAWEPAWLQQVHNQPPLRGQACGNSTMQWVVLAATQVPGLTLRLLLWLSRLLRPLSTSAALPPRLCTAPMRSPAASGPVSSDALLAIACRHSIGQMP